MLTVLKTGYENLVEGVLTEVDVVNLLNTMVLCFLSRYLVLIRLNLSLFPQEHFFYQPPE